MARAMCGAKLMEKKRTMDLIEMLGLKETVVQMAKAIGSVVRVLDLHADVPGSNPTLTTVWICLG